MVLDPVQKMKRKGWNGLKKSSEQGFEEAIRSLKNMENVNKSRHEYLRSLGLGSSDLGDGGNSSNRYHSRSMLNIPMRVHDQIMRSGMHSILRNNPSLDPPSPIDIPHWLSTPSMGSSASSSSSIVVVIVMIVAVVAIVMIVAVVAIVRIVGPS